MLNSKCLEELLFADSNSKSCKTAHFIPFSVNNLLRKNPSFEFSIKFCIFDTLSFMGRKSFKSHVSTFQTLKLNAHQTAQNSRLL
jgi:hypothetical protein